MDGIRMEQFPFRVLDYKAGEAWLNELGAALLLAAVGMVELVPALASRTGL